MDHIRQMDTSFLMDGRYDFSYDPTRLGFTRPVNMNKKFESDMFEKQKKTPVYLRMRPPDRTACGAANSFYIKNSDTIIATGCSKESLLKTARSAEFKFSRVFGPESSQSDIFYDCLKSSIKDFLNGMNCAVMAYGISGAGKTYTLMGTNNEPGILPRALHAIFEIANGCERHYRLLLPSDFDEVFEVEAEVVNGYIGEMGDLLKKYGNCQTPNKEKKLFTLPDKAEIDVEIDNSYTYEFWVSFVELYKESVYDLLSTTDSPNNRTKLKICNNKDGIACVKDLTIYPVRSADEAYAIMKIGMKSVQYNATPVNENSSRSHCIFKLTMVRSDGESATVNSFKFCDLAGSERARKSNASGNLLKESQYINASLHVLNRCLRIIRENQRHPRKSSRLVPYRESRLTKLFQQELSGKGILSIIVAINPDPEFFSENMETLNFGAIAKDITMNDSSYKHRRIPIKANWLFPIVESREPLKSIGNEKSLATKGVIENKVPVNCNLRKKENCDYGESDEDNDDDNAQICAIMIEKDNIIDELLAENAKIKADYEIREEMLRADLKEQHANILAQIQQSHQKNFKTQEKLYEQQLKAAVQAAIGRTRAEYEDYGGKHCKNRGAIQTYSFF